MSLKGISYDNLTVRVCVDKKGPTQISGRIYSRFLAEPIYFSDVGNLILQLDDFFDKLDFPRAFQKKRIFQSKQSPDLDETQGCEPYCLNEVDIESYGGEVATFTVLVTSRQNTSWQGYFNRLDGSSPQKFRSALELIRFVSVFT